jgi:hypothetical protein
MFTLEQCRERLDGGNDVQAREYGSPCIVLAHPGVAKQDQQFIAGRLMDVPVVASNRSGASTAERLPAVLPQTTSPSWRASLVEPTTSHEHDRHEPQIATARERVLRIGRFRDRPLLF